jgi:hypothetical protein
MSSGTRPRPLTPPVAGNPPDQPKELLKRLAIRPYNSVEVLRGSRDICRSASSSGSAKTIIRTVPRCGEQHLVAQQKQNQPEMFSQLFNHTQTFHSRDIDRQRGDFDVTPSPSAHQSSSDMSVRNVDDLASSISSTSRSGAYRHAFLKPSSGGPLVLDRDLPVPPVLSWDSPTRENIPRDVKPVTGSMNCGGLQLRTPTASQPNNQNSPISFEILSKNELGDFTLPKNKPTMSRTYRCTHEGNGSLGPDIDYERPPSPHSRTSSSTQYRCPEEQCFNTKLQRTRTGGDISAIHAELPLPKHRDYAHPEKVTPSWSLGASSDQTVLQHGDTTDDHIGHYSPASSQDLLVELCNLPEKPKSLSSVDLVSHDSPADDHDTDKYPHRDITKANRMTFNVEPNSHVAEGSIATEVGNRSKSFPGRSLVRSSLDYRQTAQWLRELLRYPESYKSKLTELPAEMRLRKKRSFLRHSPSIELGRPRAGTAPVLSDRDTLGGITSSSNCAGQANGNGLMSTVNSLEKLLSEALALASQFVDHQDCNIQGVELQTLGLESQHQSQDSGPEIGYQSPESDRSYKRRSKYGSKSFYNVELEDQHETHHPAYRHAATMPIAKKASMNRIENNYRMPLSFLNSSHSVAYEIEQCNPRDCESKGDRKFGRQIDIPPRGSSTGRSKLLPSRTQGQPEVIENNETCSIDGDASDEQELVDFATQYHMRRRAGSQGTGGSLDHARLHALRSTGEDALPERDLAGRRIHNNHRISLRGRSHVSLRGIQGFSLVKSHRRQPIARDWSIVRKRFVASVACISTALVGILLGIYAGLVPSIQYYIIDTSHATVTGNVGCFLGMAIPTFFCWPLPLLHGRKPYVLSSLALSMPLLFPQALAVSSQRMQHIAEWRMVLLGPRCIMGLTLGFASMNFHSTLTDLFGASLMSGNPHQEVVDTFDVRRHGGGMGVWLGIWTWCFIGSLGLGFLIGATIIDKHSPAWGFYLSIIIVAVVLLLNVLCPEVRRSAYRRSVAEVRTGTDISRRVARGEVMMHRVKTGPRWWGEETYHGILLSLEMLRQPGFLVMAVYCGWIYAQVVLIIVLLGSLASRFYRLHATWVGFAVASIALGALVAVPFQKANLFSRARHHQENTNRMTLDSRVTWTSHLLRRAVFTVVLPMAGVGYAIVSSGPPIHVSIPTIFAAAVGFLSCLAISECNGLIMETFDTSDLQPGMTGRSRGGGKSQKRTNYSSFPRVTAAFAICHTLGFVFAAGATALGGMAQRNLGQRAATGVVAGILFILTLLLLLVLIRFKEVQIIPTSRTIEMERWTAVRRESLKRQTNREDPSSCLNSNEQYSIHEDEPWRPAMMGNPVGKTRRVNILELGSMSRWTEIRLKNMLIDAGQQHLNLAALDMAADALDDHAKDLMQDAGELVRKLSQRSQLSLSRRGARENGRGARKESDSQSAEALVKTLNMKTTSTSASYPPLKSEVFVERECVIGQAVPEVDERWLTADNLRIDEALARDHGSHMLVSKVRPMQGNGALGAQKGKGKGKEE